MNILEKTPQRLILRMESNESLANAIRRSVSEIPTLAIDEVEIFKNDSALYDEMLSHRLGLVPLKTEKSMSGKTKVELKLSKTGPCVVYSEDLQGNAEVVHGKIPLTILGNGHKLELVAAAGLGKGIEHAKYTSGLCYYRHVLNVKSSTEIDKIVQKSSGMLMKAEKKGNSWLCDLSDAELEEIRKLDKAAVADSDEILFVVESYGQIEAKDMLAKAIDSLGENLAQVEKAFK